MGGRITVKFSTHLEPPPVEDALASALENLAGWFPDDEHGKPQPTLMAGCPNDLRASLERAADALMAYNEQTAETWAVVFTDVEAENGALQRKALVRLFRDRTAALDEGVSLIRDNVSDQSRANWDGMDEESVRKVLDETGTYCEAEWVVAVVEADVNG